MHAKKIVLDILWKIFSRLLLNFLRYIFVFFLGQFFFSRVEFCFFHGAHFFSSRVVLTIFSQAVLKLLGQKIENFIGRKIFFLGEDKKHCDPRNT